jgi:uncharacterized protein
MSLTCPKCQGEMRAYERNGVTVDQCAECRGLFLDRGELEKLIDAESAWSGAGAQPAPQAAPPPPPPPYYQQPHHQQQPYGYSYGGKPYYKKRKSFLSELFDD